MKNAIGTLLVNGSHAPATAPVVVYVAPTPAIEDMGGGWFRVVGSELGPVDRHGRENAEATLAAIIAGRKA